MTDDDLLHHIATLGIARPRPTPPGTDHALAVGPIKVARAERASDTFMRARWRERVRTGGGACYMHACLRYVTQQPMTNSSLRARFKIADRNASTAPRILTDAVDKGLIVVADPAAGPRLRRYLPSWAGA